ncbi:MAG: exonuclease domain-containing protein [Thermoguttaceae bacterium]|jgi:DNA polymerase III epsilon subunit family exonuclease|nr:exonuclease domain-containing protein [Thermoguttaceae bacterium]
MDDLPLGKVTFLAFDLETTGLDPSWCRIVEFGAVRFKLGEPENACYSQLVDPECPIPWEVIRIHGITPAMVRGKPTVAETLPEFLAFLGNQETVLLAHHARFDLGFLRAALAGAGIAPPGHAVIDTLDLARTCLPALPTHRLEYLASRLGVADREEHRGLSDARLVMAIFRRMVSDRPDLKRLGDLFALSPPLRITSREEAAVRLPPGFEALVDAVEASRVIEMVYDGGTRGLSRRRITPRGLYRSGGRPYLVAYCHLDQMEKTFRVDRIREFHIET